MDKTIIWALFDDGNGSWYKLQKELEHQNYEIISVGINQHHDWKNYHQIDLSSCNFNLMTQLNNLPKPDIIVTSPPCESWSIADAGGRMILDIGWGSHGWVIRNKQYYDNYNEIANAVKRRWFENKEVKRIIGEATCSATLLIIKHFKPKVWVIENPATSCMWKYIGKHWCFNGFENTTYYSNYNPNYSLKPTTFFSNIKMDLKKDTKLPKNNKRLDSCYDKRSEIPKEMLMCIIENISNHINKK